MSKTFRWELKCSWNVILLLCSWHLYNCLFMKCKSRSFLKQWRFICSGYSFTGGAGVSQHTGDPGRQAQWGCTHFLLIKTRSRASGHREQQVADRKQTGWAVHGMRLITFTWWDESHSHGDERNHVHLMMRLIIHLMIPWNFSMVLRKSTKMGLILGAPHL